MATTTTNYGFDVPTSSDLVKNGATQIALLGQDLDTFLFRPFSRNGTLNSALNVWQRGTSVSVTSNTATYTADRWNLFPNGATNAHTVSRQATGDTTNLPDIQYCGRFQRNSGQTGTGNIFLCNSFESINSAPFIGKQVTFSFYARRGANFSSASNALAFKVYTGTGTDQLSNTGYTGATAFISSTATLTTTWQRFTATATSSSSGTEVSIEFSHTPSGTAGVNDYYEITGVQLEVGNQASPFIRAGGNIQGELAMCQRYYIKSFPQATAPAQNAGGQGAVYFPQIITGAINQTLGAVRFPVVMRTSPTITTFNPSAANAQVRNVNNASNWSSTTPEQTSDAGFGLQATGNASGAAGDRALIHYTAEAEL